MFLRQVALIGAVKRTRHISLCCHVALTIYIAREAIRQLPEAKFRPHTCFTATTLCLTTVISHQPCNQFINFCNVMQHERLEAHRNECVKHKQQLCQHSFFLCLRTLQKPKPKRKPLLFTLPHTVQGSCFWTNDNTFVDNYCVLKQK